MSPQLIAYLMSFLTLGIFWNGQQTQLNRFARADRQLAWIHFVVLFAVSIMPFSTKLLADVSALIWWPVFLFVPEVASGRKRIVRAATPIHVLAALGVGTVAALVAFRLQLLDPYKLQILTMPSDWILALFIVLFGAARSLRWIVPLKYVGGWVAYVVIAFLVLYRAKWRNDGKQGCDTTERQAPRER